MVAIGLQGIKYPEISTGINDQYFGIVVLKMTLGMEIF